MTPSSSKPSDLAKAFGRRDVAGPAGLTSDSAGMILIWALHAR